MKTYEKLKEFCDHELEQYSGIESYEIEFNEEYADYHYFELDVKNSLGNTKTLYIRIDKRSLVMEIEIHDNVYEEFEYLEYTIKEFWMAYLEWPE